MNPPATKLIKLAIKIYNTFLKLLCSLTNNKKATISAITIKISPNINPKII